jgi:hypothetical protein
MVPSLISMMAPTVRRKGLPKIIEHEVLHSTSITRKSMGTRLFLTIIRTSSIVTLEFPEIQSARYVFHHNPRIIVVIHIT